MTRRELLEFAALVGQPAYRGRQLYRWLYAERESEFSRMTDLPLTLRQVLSEMAVADPLRVVKEQTGFDGSLKLLLETVDGERLESVLIPEGERLTACLSSQVGCAVGCRFCATGLMGFKRNLTAGEIIAQLFALERACGRRMTNIVMMGMGEPLLNRPALFKAITILTDPDGVGISRRQFTVSTAGWLPGIRAMTREAIEGRYRESSVGEIREGRRTPPPTPPASGGEFREGNPPLPLPSIEGGENQLPPPSREGGKRGIPRVKLAISLNATTDEARRDLMPLAGRYPLAETLAAAAEYARVSGERVSINYLLLAGKNDTDDDARRLTRLLALHTTVGRGRGGSLLFKINIMEHNDVGAEFTRAMPQRVEAFARILTDAGLTVTVRTSRGRDIAAACGQLAGEVGRMKDER